MYTWRAEKVEREPKVVLGRDADADVGAVDRLGVIVVVSHSEVLSTTRQRGTAAPFKRIPNTGIALALYMTTPRVHLRRASWSCR